MCRCSSQCGSYHYHSASSPAAQSRPYTYAYTSREHLVSHLFILKVFIEVRVTFLQKNTYIA